MFHFDINKSYDADIVYNDFELTLKKSVYPGSRVRKKKKNM